MSTIAGLACLSFLLLPYLLFFASAVFASAFLRMTDGLTSVGAGPSLCLQLRARSAWLGLLLVNVYMHSGLCCCIDDNWEHWLTTSGCAGWSEWQDPGACSTRRLIQSPMPEPSLSGYAFRFGTLLVRF